jgi:hypothetical protein
MIQKWKTNANAAKHIDRREESDQVPIRRLEFVATHVKTQTHEKGINDLPFGLDTNDTKTIH